MPARAVENQCYVAGVNRIGKDGNDIAYTGDSGAYDYFGRPVAECGEKAACVTVTLSGAELLRYREKFPAYLDADSFRIE